MPTVRVLAVRTKSGRWLMLDICTDTPTPLRWNEPERILAVGDGLVLAEVQGAVALYRLERRAACGAPTAKGASQTERD